VGEQPEDPLAAANLLGRIDRSWLIEWTRILGFQLIHRLTILIFTFLTLFFLFRDGERLIQQASTVVDRFFGATGTRLAACSPPFVTVNGLVLVGFGEGLLPRRLCDQRIAASGAAGRIDGSFATVPLAPGRLGWERWSVQPVAERRCRRFAGV
jgi:hypothetical protein